MRAVSFFSFSFSSSSLLFGADSVVGSAKTLLLETPLNEDDRDGLIIVEVDWVAMETTGAFSVVVWFIVLVVDEVCAGVDAVVMLFPATIPVHASKTILFKITICLASFITEPVAKTAGVR